MKNIWKFPLLVTGTQTIVMPKAAKVIHIAMEADTLCLWALCDFGKRVRATDPIEEEERAFYIAGTGHELPHDIGAYLGTAIVKGGVWHVFDAPPRRPPEIGL